MQVYLAQCAPELWYSALVVVNQLPSITILMNAYGTHIKYKKTDYLSYSSMKTRSLTKSLSIKWSMKEICQGVHKFIDPWWFGLTAIAVPPDPDYPAVPLSGSIDLNTVDPAFYNAEMCENRSKIIHHT